MLKRANRFSRIAALLPVVALLLAALLPAMQWGGGQHLGISAHALAPDGTADNPTVISFTGTASDVPVVLENGKTYLIEGTYGGTIAANGAVISAAAGVSATVFLRDAVIDVSATAKACAFAVASGADVTVNLLGASTLTSGSDRAGLEAPTGATLTVNGPGGLAATGTWFGAGIGGGLSQASGTITINSGRVDATGVNNGAGIGGGLSGEGAPTINGGTVTATGRDGGAGIGGGDRGTGTPTLNGGRVTATGDNGGAGIGGGREGDGTVTITGGEVNAVGGNAAAGDGGGAGIGGGSGGDGTVTLYTLPLSAIGGDGANGFNPGDGGGGGGAAIGGGGGRGGDGSIPNGGNGGATNIPITFTLPGYSASYHGGAGGAAGGGAGSSAGGNGGPNAVSTGNYFAGYGGGAIGGADGANGSSNAPPLGQPTGTNLDGLTPLSIGGYAATPTGGRNYEVTLPAGILDYGDLCPTFVFDASDSAGATMAYGGADPAISGVTALDTTGLAPGSPKSYTLSPTACSGAAGADYTLKVNLTVPAAPGSFAATPATGEVALSWADQNDAVGFNLYRDGTLVNTSGPLTGTSTTDTGLAGGRQYSYTLKAVDWLGGEGAEASLNATPQKLPAPTTLSATGGDGQAALSWGAVAGATGYNIYVDGQKVNNAPVTGTSYTATGLMNGQSYTFEVAAIDTGGGEGNKSAAAQATPYAQADPTQNSIQAPKRVKAGEKFTFSATGDKQGQYGKASPTASTLFMPSAYSFSSSAGVTPGVFKVGGPYKASAAIQKPGTYTLTVSYNLYRQENGSWVRDDAVVTEETTITVQDSGSSSSDSSSSSGGSSSGSSSSSGSGSSTGSGTTPGDTLPLLPLIGILCTSISGLVALVVFKARHRA